ncbi:MAG: ribbon-helix-helix protein, CopG family [Acidobacteria bacterium]|nr:ribbon-helix-helix protein, CopG family [Acidobacteriota bacterium]
MPSTSTTSLKLDPDMKARVQRLAASQRRTSHWIMREAIENYVSREEKREQLRLETIASWEDYKRTGLHVTDEEMDDWLTKLESGEDAPPPACHV